MKSCNGYICEDNNKKLHLIAADETLKFQKYSLCGIKISPSHILNLEDNPFNFSDFIDENSLPLANKICPDCKKYLNE